MEDVPVIGLIGYALSLARITDMEVAPVTASFAIGRSIVLNVLFDCYFLTSLHPLRTFLAVFFGAAMGVDTRAYTELWGTSSASLVTSKGDLSMSMFQVRNGAMP
jgi:hypothetical protein